MRLDWTNLDFPPSLEFRRLRGDMNEVFKNTNNIYDSQTTSLSIMKIWLVFNVKKLTKPHINYKPFEEKYFSNIIINVWNSLLGHVVNSDYVNDFYFLKFFSVLIYLKLIWVLTRIMSL